MAPLQLRACAVRTAPDGDLRCWGSGALQVPADLSSVGGALRVASLAVADTHACALMRDGSLQCFGVDDVGQVSATSTSTAWTSATHGTDPDAAFRAVCVHNRYVRPLLAQATLSWVCTPPLTATLCVGSRYTCGLLNASNLLRCWGDPVTVPVDLDGQPWFDVACGQEHVCATSGAGGKVPAGRVVCWGRNYAPRSHLTDPTAGNNVVFTHVCVGLKHTCALTRDGRVRCMGPDANAFLRLPAGIKASQIALGNPRGVCTRKHACSACLVCLCERLRTCGCHTYARDGA